jgi:hypothetical protein
MLMAGGNEIPASEASREWVRGRRGVNLSSATCFQNIMYYSCLRVLYLRGTSRGQVFWKSRHTGVRPTSTADCTRRPSDFLRFPPLSSTCIAELHIEQDGPGRYTSGMHWQVPDSDLMTGFSPFSSFLHGK